MTMKSTLLSKIISSVVILSLVSALIPSTLTLAAPGDKLYINPNSSQMNIGTVFNANVRIYVDNESGTVTTSGTVTYPTDRLQVMSPPSTSGSAFSFSSLNQGYGAITFNASRPADGGSQLFTIQFKAIAAGSAAVGFAGSSTINGEALSLESQRIPGIYTITITNPNPTPTTSTTPKPSATVKPPVSVAPTTTAPVAATPAPSSAPIVTPDPTGLINDINTSSDYSGGTVKWKVNAQNSSSTFAYGPSTTQLNNKITPTKNNDGTFQVSITSLTPGTRYVFYITAAGADDKSGNYTSTIFTRGYPVTIKVTENKQTVTKGQLRIGSTSTQISSSGIASVGLAAGNYTGTITTDTASLTINLTVAAKDIPTDGSAPETQTMNYDLKSSVLEQGPGSGDAILTFALVIGGGSIALAMGFVGFMAYRRKKFESDGDGFNTYRSAGPSVVIDDGYTWHEPDTTAVVNNTPYAPTTDASGTVHNNSVYIDEEEPLDMFAKPTAPQVTPSATVGDPDVTEQNSSSQRPTTP